MSGRLTLNHLLEGYRDADTINYISGEIRKLSEMLEKKIRLMEVCGGHTHIIAKYGLEQIIPENIEFIHGPGCPVCIMPKERIDHAYILSRKPGVILVTLGDMMKVPGSMGSLFDARAEGADIRFVYSPVDALEIAAKNRERKVVFFAIGFETTTPMTAALIRRQVNEGIDNIYYHVNHVTVPEPMEAVISEEDSEIDAFIAPSHVSVITGAKIYQPIVEKFRLPVVVGGFEPVDIMESVLMIVRQLVEGRADLEIEYKRGVSYEGNTRAQEMINACFEKAPVFKWRGIGEIPGSSLKLKEKYSHIDAEMIYTLPNESIDDHQGCLCGEILKGKSKPFQCGAFGKSCTPQSPLGACMVSDEGSCSAYYRYGRF